MNRKMRKNNFKFFQIHFYFILVGHIKKYEDGSNLKYLRACVNLSYRSHISHLFDIINDLLRFY